MNTFRAWRALPIVLLIMTGAAAAQTAPPPEPAPPAPPVMPPPEPPPPPPTREEIAKALVMRQRGESLPESFLAQDWEKALYDSTVLSRCVAAPGGCRTYTAELNGAAPKELLIAEGRTIQLYAQKEAGWRLVGEMQARCGPGYIGAFFGVPIPSARKAGELRRNDFTPAPAPFSDLIVGGERFSFIPARAVNCDK